MTFHSLRWLTSVAPMQAAPHHGRGRSAPCTRAAHYYVAITVSSPSKRKQGPMHRPGGSTATVGLPLLARHFVPQVSGWRGCRGLPWSDHHLASAAAHPPAAPCPAAVPTRRWRCLLALPCSSLRR